MEKINGLKTLIGLLLLIPAIAQYITSEDIEIIINSLVVISGGVMTIIGVAHKIIKNIK